MTWSGLGRMRLWGTVHPALGADVDEATAFLARGTLVNTLTSIKLPSDDRESGT
ncbi:hypothetical protein GCM10010269_83500 [Streptomyces humidus]|uniref:Uncharacterized protein n=1 Tax=Streptomyces humidus TaxID=52259 RepID=A0A918GEF7_9ACTN|nr:hypothetical protein GCM10010269_83500 [Streptomyces humidus]